MATSSLVPIKIRLFLPPGPVVAQLNKSKPKAMKITKTTEILLILFTCRIFGFIVYPDFILKVVLNISDSNDKKHFELYTI
jgi:hypothetical protein